MGIQQPQSWKLIRAVHVHLVRHLRQFGLDMNEYPSHHGDLSCWTVKKAKFAHTDEFNVELDQWAFCPVRLAVPVMSYGAGSFFELDRVLTLLKDDFSAFVNDSCTLSVNVGCIDAPDGGNRESLGFPLSTARALLKFVWTFEEQINTIHPPERVSEPQCTTPNALLSYIPQRTVVRCIERCPDMENLCRLWDGSPNYITRSVPNPLACSIGGMVSHRKADCIETGNRTIRFEQHRGTLDFEEIYNWVMLLGHFVRAADVSGTMGWPVDLMLWFDGHSPAKTSDVDIIDLLRSLNALDQAMYYESRLYIHVDRSAPSGSRS